MPRKFTTQKCSKCGREIKGPSFYKHTKACKGTKRAFVDRLFKKPRTKAVEVKVGEKVETPRTPKPAKLYLTSLIVDLERARDVAKKALRARIPKKAKAFLENLLHDYEGAISWSRAMLDLVDHVETQTFVATLGRHGERLKLKPDATPSDDDG